MREGWNRATAEIELSISEAETLLRTALPEVRVTDVVPTEGGLANTNLKIQLAGDAGPLLLRFCVRDSSSAAREFHLLERVENKVAVPHRIHYSNENSVNGHSYILMEWVEGVRLETIIDSLQPNEIEPLGESLGEALAGIHSVTFEQAGFFDENLNVASPMTMGCAGLLSYARECLEKPLVKERIDIELGNNLLNFLDKRSGLLDEWQGEPCLTHCDFNGSNILVNKSVGLWKVAAVLDWEFAFSGTPFFDFGNLLRAPIGEVLGMERAVEKGYRNAGGNLPQQWRQMSKLTDLTAWLDFLTRESAGPRLISDAKAQIAKTIKK